MLRVKTSLLFILLLLFMVDCRQSSKAPNLAGENVSFIFGANNHALISYVIKDQVGLKDTIYVQKSADADYFIVLDDQKISFNPDRVEVNEGLLFSHNDSLFDASISWKIIFDDAVLIEYSIIPKSAYNKIALGINALQLNAETIEAIYCVPHSLPYFRSKELNKIPAGWINNAGTLNNTFSLITQEATFSLSVLPPEYRLDNELTIESIHDYAITFDGSEVSSDSNAVSGMPGLDSENCSGQITALAKTPFAVNAGDTIVKRFMIHVSKNSADYATGKHLGQYMATVAYKKEVNANELYLKSMDFLLNNTGCFNESEQHGDNYWGSVHSGTGTAFGNGTAYYAMYGNSFSTAALNQFKILDSLGDEGEKRLNAVTNFLTNSPSQNQNGSFWSMLLLLNDQVKYSDQAYGERIWTHATAWVTYYLLEAYEISGDKNSLETAKKALSWLVNQQGSDGSFPKYFENGKPCDDKQGDSGWNALAFFKAAKLNITINEELTPEAFIQKGINAVDWICNNQLLNKKFYGSFEDVGGVVDCYASTICARATLKAYELSTNINYLQAGKSMLTNSLAWVTCDYNTLNHDAAVNSWAKDKHWQPAYAHIESTSCYYPCSYTLPMLYLVATEYAAFVSGDEQLFWIKIAQNMSHLNSFFNQDPNSKSINGMEWRMFPFLVFTEWGNAQTCYSILKSLTNRVTLSFPYIQFSPEFTTNIKGEQYKLILTSGDEQICKTDSEIDYLTLISEKKDNAIIALLTEGKSIEGALKFNRNFLLSMKGESDEIKLSNFENKKEIGTYSLKELSEGIKLDLKISSLLKIH